MMTVIGSVKGSPGVTTFALALAVAWPAGSAVLVEADPAGGDLGGRFGVPDQPGLTTLAVHTRRARRTRPGRPEPPVAGYTQRLPVGADVVIAPAAGRPAAAAVRLLAASRGLGHGDDDDTLIDAGRLYEGSPAWGLVAAADALLVVSGADLCAIDRTVAFTATHRGIGPAVAVVLVGGSPFTGRELTAELPVPVAVHAPTDRRAAAILAGHGQPVRGWTRVGLVAAARTVAVRTRRPEPATPTRPPRAGPDPAAPHPAPAGPPGAGTDTTDDAWDGTGPGRPAPATRGAR